MKIPNNWWPPPLIEFSQENPLDAENIVVAEISEPWGGNSWKHLLTGLVTKSQYKALVKHRGCIGHEIESPGPWPSSHKGKFNYKPSFWIKDNDWKETIEPLIVSWASANKTIFLPDQGFLMTYGLIPRACDSGELFWDDPKNRIFNVVQVEPPSEFSYELVKESRVLIRREYLQDYAAVRDMHIIQVYFVENISNEVDSLSKKIVHEGLDELVLPQRTLCIRQIDDSCLHAQIWGFRFLLNPENAPVSDDEDYGILNWPGYGEVNGSEGMRLFQLPQALKYIYVSDEVLGEYEGHPGFSISPESGAVSYGNQWKVVGKQRIGRDLIQVELKKLYEGNRPKTVKTWNKYCVNSPANRDMPGMSAELNIAKRAKRIVYALLELGDVLAVVSSKATGKANSSKDLVGLDRNRLEQNGWWTEKIVEPISRHVPLKMKECEFLERCVDLSKVVIDGLSETILRESLVTMAIAGSDMKELRSLKLLDLLVQKAIISANSGLNLFIDASEIEKRRKENCPKTRIVELESLKTLRNYKTHRDNRKKDNALKYLRICVPKMVPGWGAALDIVYDKLADAISEITKILQSGVTS